MSYHFSEKDCRRIESWARNSNFHAILSLIESKPVYFRFSRPVLIGSKGGADYLIEGTMTRISFSAAVAELDEPFDSRAPFYRKKTFAPQNVDLSEAIFGTLQSGLRKGYGKVCYLASTGECQHGIIRAHLIQEALVRLIAVDGHVLQFNCLNLKPPRPSFLNWPVKVGVNDVNTFTGFCGHHDHLIFLPIESGAFKPTAETMFLYAYRTLCSSLYLSEYKFELIKRTHAAASARQAQPNEITEHDIAGNDRNLSELSAIKIKWDRHLLTRDFAPFQHLVLTCPHIPDILGSAFLAPWKTFQQRPAQSKFSETVDWIAFSILPRHGGGGVVLISAAEGNKTWRLFVDSLVFYPPEKRTMVIVNFILCHFGEQLILSPRWWESLTNESQEAVVHAHAAGYYPRHLKGLCDWGPLMEVGALID